MGSYRAIHEIRSVVAEETGMEREAIKERERMVTMLKICTKENDKF
jgi:hypothetical protein